MLVVGGDETTLGMMLDATREERNIIVYKVTEAYNIGQYHSKSAILRSYIITGRTNRVLEIVNKSNNIQRIGITLDDKSLSFKTFNH